MSAPVPTVIQALALAIWLCAGGWALAIDDPRLRYPEHLVALAVMAAAWLWTIRNASAFSSRATSAGLALGLLLRIACIFSAPAFSDDAFRYVYEGRVVWYEGPAFPFLHPPAEAPALSVPAHLLDEAWLRINHPHITTIYPPLSQLVFAIAGGLGELFGAPLAWLKLLLVGADLATLAVLIALLKRTDQPIALSLSWALSPVVIFEIAREGHADSLSALGLALGMFTFLLVRPRLGYAGFAIAALSKLNGLIAIGAALRTTRRGALLGIGLASLVCLPLFFGGQAAFGLSQYATRWKSGDGLFSLILLLAERIVGGDWRQLTESGFTITKHQLARAIAALLWIAVAFRVLRPRAPIEAIPKRAGLLLLLLLLIAPTLHPWYVVWVLPFVVVEGLAAPILTLAFLAPLLHHPTWLALETGEWTDLGWVRAVVHIPVWSVLLYAGFRCRSKKDSCSR